MFHEALKQALKVDARRPKHERRTAKALYAEIKVSGYGGGYTGVTDFVRASRQGQGQGAAVNAFIPLAFELGEAYPQCRVPVPRVPSHAPVLQARRQSSCETPRPPWPPH